jgi:hypothetical protein
MAERSTGIRRWEIQGAGEGVLRACLEVWPVACCVAVIASGVFHGGRGQLAGQFVHAPCAPADLLWPAVPVPGVLGVARAQATVQHDAGGGGGKLLNHCGAICWRATAGWLLAWWHCAPSRIGGHALPRR